MKRILLATAAFALGLGASPSFAQGQPYPSPGRGGGVVETEGDNTGGNRDVIFAPGATGAETIESDSAAGGNASQPSRRVPQGSGGGGGDN